MYINSKGTYLRLNLLLFKRFLVCVFLSVCLLFDLLQIIMYNIYRSFYQSIVYSVCLQISSISLNLCICLLQQCICIRSIRFSREYGIDFLFCIKFLIVMTRFCFLSYFFFFQLLLKERAIGTKKTSHNVWVIWNFQLKIACCSSSCWRMNFLGRQELHLCNNMTIVQKI